MPQYYEGQILIRPQAISKVKEETIIGDQPPNSLIVAIISQSDGGKPREFQRVYGYNEAKAIFRSGPLVDLLQRLYQPAQSVPGAYQVLVYRLNDALQATGALKDAAVANVITLATRDYGLHTNQVRIKVEAGTTSNTYKLSIQGYDGSAAIVKDNIGRSVMQIQYTGAGSAAAMTISATQLATTITGAAGDSVTLTFASYATIQSLADALAATGKYTVTVLSDGRVASSTLDEVTAVDVMTTAYTIRANIQAVIDYINNEEPYLLATRVTGKALVTASTYIALTGGANDNTAVTSTTWQNAFTALQGESCNIVLPGSEDSTIHAMASAHCVLMSASGGNKERVAVVGGVDESVDAVSLRARNLNTDRVAICYPGLKDTNSLGAVVNYSPMYTAAAVAGILAGGEIGQPATRKPVRCIAPVKKLTESEQDSLLLNGVLPIVAHDAEGARIVQSISTYAATEGALSLIKRELSSRIASDVLISRVRTRLDNELIGTASGPLTKERAKNITESVLKTAQADGIIVGDQQNPAYSDLSVIIQGETVVVSFGAKIVAPTNYVVLSASLKTYSG